MEIYNETGKTKTNSLSVTRPIGALLVEMSQPFASLTNETITAFIERANGNNTEILPADYPLKAFLACSTIGNPAVFQIDGKTSVLAELCEEGSINLLDGETIKIKLDGLKSTVTYSLFGLEMPRLANSVSKFDRKIIMQGEAQRRFEISEQEVMLIEGIDSIIEMNVAFSSGLICKYVPEEIKAISRDVDAVKLIIDGVTPEAAKSVSFDLPNLVSFPLINEWNRVINIDIKKKTDGAVTIFLKNNVQTY